LEVSAKIYRFFKKDKKKNFKKVHKLEKLRTICSTGSPLSADCFKYLYKNIKKKVHLASILEEQILFLFRFG